MLEQTPTTNGKPWDAAATVVYVQERCGPKARPLIASLTSEFGSTLENTTSRQGTLTTRLPLCPNLTQYTITMPTMEPVFLDVVRFSRPSVQQSFQCASGWTELEGLDAVPQPEMGAKPLTTAEKKAQLWKEMDLKATWTSY
jgi:hypothetical protein